MDTLKLCLNPCPNISESIRQLIRSDRSSPFDQYAFDEDRYSLSAKAVAFITESEEVMAAALLILHADSLIEIHKYYVRHDSRRMGIGRRFAADLIALFREDGYETVVIEYISPEADSFWARIGFSYMYGSFFNKRFLSLRQT